MWVYCEEGGSDGLIRGTTSISPFFYNSICVTLGIELLVYKLFEGEIFKQGRIARCVCV